MAQSSQQFTPAQILEAGRRAEVEGRVEYAIQFYRHLTDHLPRSNEAAAAREALTKLGAQSAEAAFALPLAPSPAPVSAYPNGQSAMNGIAAGQTFSQAPAASASVMQPRRQQPLPMNVNGMVPKPVFVMPKTRRRYRTGRLVARAFSFFGFLLIAIGTLIMIGGLLSLAGGGSTSLPSAISSQAPWVAISGGFGLVLTGLLVVLGGQLARAQFDTASANRDIAAIARARAIFDTGASPPSQQPEI